MNDTHLTDPYLNLGMLCDASQAEISKSWRPDPRHMGLGGLMPSKLGNR